MHDLKSKLQDTVKKYGGKIDEYEEKRETYVNSKSKPNGRAGGQLFLMFSQVEIQIHAWHLQTNSEAEHTTLNDFYNGIKEFRDEFMELFMGTNDTRIAGNSDNTIKIDLGYGEGKAKEYIKEFKHEVVELYESDIAKCPCLKAKIEELFMLINKTLYLLTLK